MKVAVGSTNPTKINAAKMAFAKIFPQETIDVVGLDVGSDIADQPKSITEALTGATNRAKKALEQADADFGVGLEGGMHEIPNGKWMETGWCVIVNPQNQLGIGSSIHMEVPPKLMHHIAQGKELGMATDIVFNEIESKKKAGFFGLMTNNHIDRTSAYADGVIAALTRFLHPHLFT